MNDGGDPAGMMPGENNSLYNQAEIEQNKN
jgi:hypothetical protein